jgi:hypothetical protein
VTRVNVVVEGETEESFVRSVLAAALWPHQVSLIPIGIEAMRRECPHFRYWLERLAALARS